MSRSPRAGVKDAQPPPREADLRRGMPSTYIANPWRFAA